MKTLSMCYRPALVTLLLVVHVAPAFSESSARVRIQDDMDAGKPLVAHVTVVLCDNENQAIAPVPEALGDGQDPGNNLYWGALYGVKTFLTRKAGWTALEFEGKAPSHVLERLVLTARLPAEGTSPRRVYLVADAWDGARMREGVGRFQQHLDGRRAETVRIPEGTGTLDLQAGGRAHLVGFVGHNGLMEFEPPHRQRPHAEAPARAAMVLACMSRPYFADLIKQSGAQPLLLTNHLMAPEAYTLNAAVRAWFSGGTEADVREAAAVAYDRYQKCGMSGARRMFAAP